MAQPRDTIPISVYLTPELLARLDVLAEVLAPGGGRVSRQTAIQVAITRGVESWLEDAPKRLSSSRKKK